MIGLRTYRPSRRGVAIFILLCSALTFESCQSPIGVATFAARAQQSLNGGAAMFADIHGSCVRRHEAAAGGIPTFAPATLLNLSAGPVNEIPACAAFAGQGDALAKASDVLGAYFRALQQLASFDTSTVSGPTGQSVAGIGMATRLNATQVDSISRLADLLMQVFTERYRQEHLVSILVEADPSVASITQGFADIVSKDYEGLLSEEQQTIAAEYQGVADNKAPAITLLLNRAYLEDLNGVNRRKTSAEAYVEALRQIREGHHTLAQNARHLTGKDVMAALQPYTEKLDALLPVLQKGW